jgi:hypothetical protein
MTNELTTSSKTEIVKAEEDPYTAYADTVSPKFIVGELLRFHKGDWLVSDDVIAVDTIVVPVMESLLAGWVRWSGGKPTEQIMVRVGSGQRPPKRSELGDTEEDCWDTDANGEKRDPWQFTNYLPMILLDGARLLTFATSSGGGKNAVADLARHFG